MKDLLMLKLTVHIVTTVFYEAIAMNLQLNNLLYITSKRIITTRTDAKLLTVNSFHFRPTWVTLSWPKAGSSRDGVWSRDPHNVYSENATLGAHMHRAPSRDLMKVAAFCDMIPYIYQIGTSVSEDPAASIFTTRELLWRWRQRVPPQCW
jgi:hypothetical protein